MIQFDNVSKKYPLGNSALEDAAFFIDKQEFVFFVGPSGAGKTTILKLILKQINPSSGSIFVNDVDIADKKFHDTLKLRRSIGMIFQDFKILFDRNVFENVALSLEIASAGKKSRRGAVNSWHYRQKTNVSCSAFGRGIAACCNCPCNCWRTRYYLG